MRIKEITYQNRRDFKAIFKCPYCGYEKEVNRIYTENILTSEWEITK